LIVKISLTNATTLLLLDMIDNE